MATGQVQLRIGHGLDVHPFIEGKPLILGGCEIPYSLGLKGHSDADVLLHAITDAVLGALSWGDLGHWFPDTDAAYRGISSKVLFSKVWERAKGEGWNLLNCDSVILAEEPKLAEHVPKMREIISSLFEAPVGSISVKATTTERLGFIGRSEGIAASAVVLLHLTA